MVKRIKTQQKPKIEGNKGKTNINLSSIIRKTNLKLSSKNKNNIPTINTTILFQINKNPLNQDNIEKEYYKRYIYYLREEFNSKIITMFFNYISLSKIIPNSFKNNIYFCQDFLNIILNLLISDIDLVILSLILDSMGWIEQGSDPWRYLYYICLSVKEISSSENTYNILLDILEKNNHLFKNSFNQWINNLKIKKILEGIGIPKINERYRILMKPIGLNENQIKYINYNEIVNKIIMSKQKENIPPIAHINDINILNNLNTNKKNLILNSKFSQLKPPMQPGYLEPMAYPSGFIYNNRFESPSKIEKQQPPILDMQKNNSFYSDKFFDLSVASRNNSFYNLSIDGDLNKQSSMRFNNK